MVVLLVLLTIIIGLTLDYLVHRVRARRAASAAAGAVPPQARAGPVPADPTAALLPPAGVFVDPTHAWVEIAPSGSARVGLDALLLRLLGPPEALLLRPAGTAVRRGEPIARLRRRDRQLELLSPIDGVIERANARLAHRCGELARAPYRANWIYRIAPRRLGAALARMRIAEDARQWLAGELRRARELLLRAAPSDQRALGLTAADGGLPVSGVSAQLDRSSWQQLLDELQKRTERDASRDPQ